MRTVLAALLLGLGLALGALAPAAAHVGAGDACAKTGRGHSAYAHHHVVPLAKDGELGNRGHKPGTRQGYHGLCGEGGDATEPGRRRLP